MKRKFGSINDFVCERREKIRKSHCPGENMMTKKELLYLAQIGRWKTGGWNWCYTRKYYNYNNFFAKLNNLHLNYNRCTFQILSQLFLLLCAKITLHKYYKHFLRTVFCNVLAYYLRLRRRHRLDFTRSKYKYK